MTLPDERYRAVMQARKFLLDLAYNRQDYPRLPIHVRREAVAILRHFPNEWDMDRTSESSPDIFQPKMDPLVRIIHVYDQEQKEEQNDKTV